MDSFEFVAQPTRSTPYVCIACLAVHSIPDRILDHLWLNGVEFDPVKHWFPEPSCAHVDCTLKACSVQYKCFGCDGHAFQPKWFDPTGCVHTRPSVCLPAPSRISARVCLTSPPCTCRRALRVRTTALMLYCLLSVFTGPETLPDSVKDQIVKPSENRSGFCALHRYFAVSHGYDIRDGRHSFLLVILWR